MISSSESMTMAAMGRRGSVTSRPLIAEGGSPAGPSGSLS